MEQEKPCLLQKLKKPWQMAGIMTVSDFSIKEKFVKVAEGLRATYKHLGTNTPAARDARDKYLVKISKTFNIKDANARAAILSDPNRDKRAKKEDISFFDDYLGPNPTRKWRLGQRDKKYDAETLSSLMTEQARRNRKEARERRAVELVEQERVERGEREEQDSGGYGQAEEPDSLGADQEGDEEYVEEEQEEGSKRKQSKWKRGSRSGHRPVTRSGGGGVSSSSDSDDDGVWLKVPRGILGITAATAVRLHISNQEHSAMVAAVLVGSGASLDDFTMSKTSSFRHSKA